ncbi:protein NUCLEAR FUSION DEFECTIVE 4-like [Phoenix dactylifera]|uniref:Protein NUCLEAR FUSION DEFECTIVE 4-like n=1 Tax=Phoenix dactylifera TaxID=42345 RepID=A0A8B7MVE6_PHODC|nr:protein NUCLEAR FUSION DEFECTIVE 4-like [Phoenix dactylifera]
MPSPSVQWLSFVGTIWLQTINGANSDFPVYSSQLKDLKSFSQVKLNFLAFASDAGKLFGWFSGLAAIFLPLWLVAVIGAIFGLVGYGVQFLFLGSTHLSYWHLFTLTALAGNGICWINTVCYIICIQNFPSDSRVAVGISTSYVGLSAKIYAVVADVIFRPQSNHDAKTYLGLNAIVPILVSILVAPFLREMETKNKARSSCGFMVMFAITLATGICAVVGSIRPESREHAISLGLLLTAPLVVPLAMKYREGKEELWWNRRERRVHDITVDEVDTRESVMDLEMREVESVDGKVEESVEVGGLQLLKKVNFWLYFFSYMFSATLGLVFLNNLGQIAESRGFSKTTTLVSLSSSFGFFGRLMPSVLDYSSTKSGYMVSRPAFMAILMAPMAGAFFLLLNPSRLFLYLGTTIIGGCTGAITSIAVSATPELFGTKHFGVNHNIVVTNIPVGSFLFGYFAAFLYQREAEGSHSCNGIRCYEKTFIIWGSTCSVATLLCTVLYARTRKFC